ncbi:MAG: hypothetical protein IPK82_42655 [Polyangiaceae bacterium]|nr:hypothetical protein [Polyangiaceae bacterium]
MNSLLPFYLPIYPSTYLPIYPSTYLPIQRIVVRHATQVTGVLQRPLGPPLEDTLNPSTVGSCAGVIDCAFRRRVVWKFFIQFE